MPSFGTEPHDKVLRGPGVGRSLFIFSPFNVDMAEAIGTTRGNTYYVRFHIDLTTFDLFTGEKKTEK